MLNILELGYVFLDVRIDMMIQSCLSPSRSVSVQKILSGVSGILHHKLQLSTTMGRSMAVVKYLIYNSTRHLES